MSEFTIEIKHGHVPETKFRVIEKIQCKSYPERQGCWQNTDSFVIVYVKATTTTK